MINTIEDVPWRDDWNNICPHCKKNPLREPAIYNRTNKYPPHENICAECADTQALALWLMDLRGISR
jgi:hypothetical protein